MLFSLIIFICSLIQPAYADQPIRIGIGMSIPPYVIEGENRGIEVDIIRAAFTQVNIPVSIRYLPTKRLPVSFRNYFLDGVAINRVFDLSRETGQRVYGSNTTVVFDNIAFTLKDGPSITSVQDLANCSVVSFENAKKYLGTDYADVVLQNEQYHEVSNQALQLDLLFSGRYSVAILDRYVFLYFLQFQKTTDAPVVSALRDGIIQNRIFKPSDRCVYFHDSNIRNMFNAGLEIIKQNGEMDRISNAYIGTDE